MAVTVEAIMRAAETIGAGSAEIDWRNATSRAYYAAYHRCLSVAMELDPTVDSRDGSGHVRVTRKLTEPSNSNMARSLGYRLDQCRIARQKADDQITDAFRRDEWLSVRAYCEEILADSASLL